LAGDVANTGNKSAVPLIGVLLDYWHRVTGVSHLWENDQLGADVFCPARKIVNLGQIRFRIAERTRNLGDCNLHLPEEATSDGYAAMGLRYPKNSRFVIRWATSGGTICSHLLSPDCNFASTSGG
jgi:hypothetical protein